MTISCTSITDGWAVQEALPSEGYMPYRHTHHSGVRAWLPHAIKIQRW